VRYRSNRQLAGFVGISKQKLSGRERCPGSVGHDFALSGLRASFNPEIVRIAEPVCIAEVFAGGWLAVNDDGGRVLRGDDSCSAGFFD
jgi:hypothetical protein